jgi:hypothetical protein
MKLDIIEILGGLTSIAVSLWFLSVCAGLMIRLTRFAWSAF